MNACYIRCWVCEIRDIKKTAQTRPNLESLFTNQLLKKSRSVYRIIMYLWMSITECRTLLALLWCPYVFAVEDYVLMLMAQSTNYEKKDHYYFYYSSATDEGCVMTLIDWMGSNILKTNKHRIWWWCWRETSRKYLNCFYWAFEYSILLRSFGYNGICLSYLMTWKDIE